MSLRFSGPCGVSFPRDERFVPSYATEKYDTVPEQPKDSAVDGSPNDEGIWNEEDIRRSFQLIDLDNNGYIGAAEIRHVLIMMGEHVSEEEVDMMISMLDTKGDGQVRRPP